MSQLHINENTYPSSDPNYFNNTHCFNTTNAVSNVWNNCTIADEDSEILAWLSPLSPQTRHDDIRARRIEKVGDWILQTEEYRNWLGGTSSDGPDRSALFCYGDPGVGKTYISSLVIDTLCKQAEERNAGVASFYFDFAAPQEQSPTVVLGSVLKQIIGGLGKVPEEIVKAYRERAVGAPKLVLSKIVEFLQDITSSRPSFICIDALDECQEGYRLKLLDLLNQILQKSPGARLFVTGRPHIRTEIEKRLAGRAAIRSITPTKNDIITFLRAKLGEDTMPDAMDKGLEEEIIGNLPGTVSQIFLLAFLSIETILLETTIYRRRQRLRAMQNSLDLGGAYGATLERIKSQGEEKERLGMAVLMWVSHSRRPLQVDEIRHALAVRIGSNDLDFDNIPGISTMLSCCQGLATIDKGTSTVRLIHFTLQEHLRTHPNLFERAHSTIAETCLTYLNFQHVKDDSSGLPPNWRGTPFLKYSSIFWGIHMRAEPSDLAKIFALQLLDQFDTHISAEILWKSMKREYGNRGFIWSGASACRGLSALHCISYFGIAQVANTLLEMNKWDVNQKDGAGITPLIWAARCGHEEVVELLLQQKDIQPDQPVTDDGRTALSWAAGNGHEGVVRLFLGPRFVNLGRIGCWWGKAPQVASLLFSTRYVNPDSSTKSGETPLWWAAENGHEGVVKTLLERRDVNPNTSDTMFGGTPLSRAAEQGHEGVVKILLERNDINPNSSSKIGEPPLLGAAEQGHEGVVKILLERKDINPNYLGQYGRTPLSCAAVNGHEGVVKILLERNDVNPNSSSGSGQTPLSCAAQNGHEGVVKILLERNDINPDDPGGSGKTPLSWAAESGHEGVVKMLLERADVNPNTPDRLFGRAPLSWAAERGHEGVVKILLERNDVNPNSSNGSGQTPLGCAAANGLDGVVKILLERKDVNADTPDRRRGQTPLSWAATNGHEGVVKMLLERNDVDPNSCSKSGETSRMIAAKYDYDRIVKLFQAQRS